MGNTKNNSNTMGDSQSSIVFTEVLVSSIVYLKLLVLLIVFLLLSIVFLISIVFPNYTQYHSRLGWGAKKNP